MIVAGIDEAGYGPLLGPLVVGCCAFELGEAPGGPSAAQQADEADRAAEGDAAEDTATPSGAAEGAAGTSDLPCLWKRLRKYVSRNRLKSGRKLHVNDSKLVYSPAGGLRELERSILAFATAWSDWPGDLPALLSRVAPDVLNELDEYPWYRQWEGETFPLEQESTSIRLFANALRLEMRRSGTRCVHLGSRVVCERQFNRMLAATRNKGSALFSLSAIHLDYLLRTYGEQGLTIVCDRQGGRERYGSLLRLMWDDWSLEIDREADGHSEYRLRKAGHVVRIIFKEKAEVDCLPVAVASMLSKYLREALMRRFNAYWKSLLPDVVPTAGYYSDGTRFLGDIDAKRRELGIADEQLVRSR